ncbi:MAG: ornithine cyclodeaminase family protein, partial [Chloroflexi bacterium]|nr:ornithine cyclodeaminase family protein [Chloroflexota bacterium]
MRLLRAADIARACPIAQAIEAVGAGFAALSAGLATVPVRASVPLAGEGVALSMPAALAGGPHWSVKLVTVAPGNPGRGLPLIAAIVLLGDAETGAPLALLDGASLTALRTGAAGGLAARTLARPESAVVALFGAGAQARTQLAAVSVALARTLREVRIVARDPGHATRLAADAARDAPAVRYRTASADEAVRGADVVITATSSAVPVFDGRLLGDGVHVTAVGSFKPTMRELDEAALRGARIV